MPERLVIATVALAALIVTADARSPALVCLDQKATREAVASGRVVAPAVALKAARAASGGEAVRARLCHSDSRLVYVVTSLRRDGRVRRIHVDAASGRVTRAR
jgi:uncharacterized membrane protein YkoI